MSAREGSDQHHAIQIDGSDSDIDSDGGIPLGEDSEMQLDSPEGSPPGGSPGSLLQLAGGEIDFIDYGAEGMGDGSDFLSTAPHPNTRPVQSRAQPGDSDPVRHRARTRTREEEHAALCVSDDWELMVTHALNSRRTIPQTRRRFLAKMLAPGNPSLEEELYGGRFVFPETTPGKIPPMVVPGRKGTKHVTTGLGSGSAWLMPAKWKEVVSHDEGSWWPEGRMKNVGSGGSGSGTGTGRKRKSYVGESRSEPRSASGSGDSRVVSRGQSRTGSRGFE
ncbi:hypothetical protein N7532_000678 [Penicillium argentinense]|uniref:Uncharacterized protein n=1 Tax=Penicillium argentinense TaxID=1131581 RepID=A0A9W9KP37_9EURO|nr:uncharacterized protein N7532_000678 [Penicillium argentinense]KAJ5112633.1 hypothetical protein N7532_000678 [Penicillium argentinense]